MPTESREAKPIIKLHPDAADARETTAAAWRIREATVEDADAISCLMVPLVERYIAHPFEPAAVQRMFNTMTADAIAGYIRAGYRYHVAESTEGIIGVASTRDNSHLYHLFVADSARRQGIATALWFVARDACLAAGHRGAFTVNASRYAEPFYLKLGFEHIKVARQHGIAHIEMRLLPETEEPGLGR